MSKIFGIPFYKGTFLDDEGHTVTKSDTNVMSNLGKGYGVKFNTINYLHSNGFNTSAHTIIIEFYLKEEVTSPGVGVDILTSLKYPGLINIGSSTGSYTDETLAWWTTVPGDGGYIRDNIPAGHNQLLMIWNNSLGKYDVWLNGNQVTVYEADTSPSPMVLSVENIYIGKREGATQYFNDYITNFEVYDDSISDSLRNNKINSFFKRSNVQPAKLNIGEWKNVFKGNGLKNTGLDFGSIKLSSSSWTVACRVKNLGTTNLYNYIVSATSKYNLSIRNSNGLINYRDSSYAYRPIGSDYNLVDGEEHSFIVRCDSSGNAYAYIDGVYKGSTSYSGTLQVRYLLEFSTGIYSLEGNAWDMRIWNSDIGATECLKYHNDVMTVTPSITHLMFDEKSGSTAYDISGVGNNATYKSSDSHENILLENVYFKESFEHEPADGQPLVPIDWNPGDGTYATKEISGQDTSNKVVNGTFDTDSDWFKGTSWTISGGTANCDGTQTGNTNLYQYNVLEGNRTYKITYDLSISAGNIKVLQSSGAVGTTHSVNGNYTEVLNTFGGSTILVFKANTNFIGSIDNVKVEELFLNPNGTKYLEAISTNGQINIQDSEAYGTWYFDIYKSADIHTINLFPISYDANNRFNASGYGVIFYADEGIRITRRNSSSTLLQTSTGYFSNNTWYRVKLTRSLTGEFTIYIKGGSFGITSWTQVVASTGSNPVTDNTYTSNTAFVVDLDVGDRITNIIHKKGVE